MYDHPYSHIRRHEDQYDDSNSDIPDYAYPTEVDILPKKVASTSTPAQATINNWVATTALNLVDRETSVLAQDDSLRMPCGWTWESVVAILLQDVQKQIMQLAPLTWSTVANIAVSPNRCRQNHSARLGTEEEIEAKKESLNHVSHSPWRVSGSSLHCRHIVKILLVGIYICYTHTTFYPQPLDFACAHCHQSAALYF